MHEVAQGPSEQQGPSRATKPHRSRRQQVALLAGCTYGNLRHEPFNKYFKDVMSFPPSGILPTHNSLLSSQLDQYNGYNVECDFRSIARFEKVGFLVKPENFPVLFQRLGCSFYCKDHAHFHIFIGTSKCDSFHPTFAISYLSFFQAFRFFCWQ